MECRPTGIPWESHGELYEAPNVSHRNPIGPHGMSHGSAQRVFHGDTMRCRMVLQTHLNKWAFHGNTEISRWNSEQSNPNRCITGTPNVFPTGVPREVAGGSKTISTESYGTPWDVAWDPVTGTPWASHETSHDTPNISNANIMGSHGMNVTLDCQTSISWESRQMSYVTPKHIQTIPWDRMGLRNGYSMG